MQKKLLFVVFLGIFIIPCLSFSQVKIGFIISEQIYQQLPEAQNAQKQLEAIQKETMDTLQSLEREAQVKTSDFQQKESLMTEDAKKKAQRELVDLQTKYAEIRQKKSEELQKKREILVQPINEKMLKTLDVVAKEENLTFIFDKSQTMPVLLYGDPEFNITNKVLDIMIRGAKSPKKKK